MIPPTRFSIHVFSSSPKNNLTIKAPSTKAAYPPTNFSRWYARCRTVGLQGWQGSGASGIFAPWHLRGWIPGWFRGPKRSWANQKNELNKIFWVKEVINSYKSWGDITPIGHLNKAIFISRSFFEDYTATSRG